VTNQSLLKIRYKVIPRTLIFLFNESKVLLIKQNSEEKTGFGKWNGIGGHIEEGEDPFSSARREIFEESGLSIENIKLKFISIIPEKKELGVCLFIFSGICENIEVKESSEGQLSWISIDHLNEYKVMPDVPKLLKLVLDQTESNCPQIISYEDDVKGIKIEIVN
jgi:8-oxo-dGTP diphosphatase